MPRILLFVFLGLSLRWVQAQSADSLARVMLAQADSLHSADSINRIILLAEIEQLKKEKGTSKD